MPLDKGCSTTAMGKNIKALTKEGKKQNQSVAIAYSVLRKACGVPSDQGKLTPKKIVAFGKEDTALVTFGLPLDEGKITLDLNGRKKLDDDEKKVFKAFAKGWKRLKAIKRSEVGFCGTKGRENVCGGAVLDPRWVKAQAKEFLKSAYPGIKRDWTEDDWDQHLEKMIVKEAQKAVGAKFKIETGRRFADFYDDLPRPDRYKAEEIEFSFNVHFDPKKFGIDIKKWHEPRGK